MPRRKDSFAQALADASKRLEKAQAERTAAQQRLVALDQEIPRLQITVAALRDQLDPVIKSEARPITERTGPPTQSPPPNLSPEDLAKWYSTVDLSKVKSIVPERPATPAPQSEEELLPDDFAIGKG